MTTRNADVRTFHRHDVRVTTAGELAAALQPLVPLRIREVEFQDPVLIVIGDHWSLALVGPWSWRRARGVEVNWLNDEAEDKAWTCAAWTCWTSCPATPGPPSPLGFQTAVPSLRSRTRRPTSSGRSHMTTCRSHSWVFRRNCHRHIRALTAADQCVSQVDPCMITT